MSTTVICTNIIYEKKGNVCKKKNKNYSDDNGVFLRVERELQCGMADNVVRKVSRGFAYVCTYTFIVLRIIIHDPKGQCAGELKRA